MKTKKQINIFLAILYAITIVAVSMILNPIYASVSTDILTKNTLWPTVIELLKTLLEFLMYTFILATVIYSNYITTKGSNKITLIIAMVGIAVKYIVNILFDLITNGASSLGSSQVLSICVYIGIEWAQVLVVFFISKSAIRSFIDAERQKFNASRSLKLNYDKASILPFESVVDKNNPLMRSSFIASLAIAIPTIAGRLIYDIVVVGAPTSVSDLLWMIVYYVFDILSIFIGYLLVIFVISVLYDIANKKSKQAPSENV